MGDAPAVDRPMKSPASRPRKLLILPDALPESSEISFSDERWATIRETLPDNLSAETELQLRSSITSCCNRFVARMREVRKGAEAAGAIRKRGGKQAAAFDQLQLHLKSAVKELAAMEGMKDPFLNLYRDQLEKIVQGIMKRGEALRGLSPMTVNPRHELVRSLARVCKRTGMAPTATHRVYDETANKPAWFQEFVASLNDNLLGAQAWGAVGSYSRKALYSDVVKALREDAKAGNPRK